MVAHLVNSVRMKNNRRHAETVTLGIVKNGPRNGAKFENRDLKKIGKTPIHRQNRGIFGPDRNMKNTVWPNIGENGPTASPKMGLKSKIVI